MMKAQLIPFIFVITVSGLILIFYIFFNIFYGEKYETHIVRVKVLDRLRNVIEQLKAYLSLSLIYSSHQALREHAYLGGVTDAGAWICNGPNPVPVSLSKECLEIFTNYYYNSYLNLYKVDLPVQLFTKNSTYSKYGVEPNEVLNPKSTYDEYYDEGNFWVNTSSINVTAKTKDIQLAEKLQTNEYLTKNRYWYMFRIFTEWANDDIYTPCVQTCTDCECTERCADLALKDLQRRFDEFVECEKREICCEFGYDLRLCRCDCEHSCLPPEMVKFGGFKSLMRRKALAPCGYDCPCKPGITVSHEFECKDYKYYVPTGIGPMPLIFKVNACETFAPCTR